jgi:hypothetical protein
MKIVLTQKQLINLIIMNFAGGMMFASMMNLTKDNSLFYWAYIIVATVTLIAIINQDVRTILSEENEFVTVTKEKKTCPNKNKLNKNNPQIIKETSS